MHTRSNVCGYSRFDAAHAAIAARERGFVKKIEQLPISDPKKTIILALFKGKVMHIPLVKPIDRFTPLLFSSKEARTIMTSALSGTLAALAQSDKYSFSNRGVSALVAYMDLICCSIRKKLSKEKAIEKELTFYIGSEGEISVSEGTTQNNIAKYYYSQTNTLIGEYTRDSRSGYIDVSQPTAFLKRVLKNQQIYLDPYVAAGVFGAAYKQFIEKKRIFYINAFNDYLGGHNGAFGVVQNYSFSSAGCMDLSYYTDKGVCCALTIDDGTIASREGKVFGKVDNQELVDYLAQYGFKNGTPNNSLLTHLPKLVREYSSTLLSAPFDIAKIDKRIEIVRKNAKGEKIGKDREIYLPPFDESKFEAKEGESVEYFVLDVTKEVIDYKTTDVALERTSAVAGHHHHLHAYKFNKAIITKR